MMGSTFSVQSGKIYRQVFTGGEGAHATLELVNSSIGEAMGLAARFVPRFRERHEVEQVESATDHFYV